jgi:hypothetical protein
MAGVLGLGISTATSGGSSTTPKQKASTEKTSTDGDYGDYAEGTFMFSFYQDNKAKIDKMAQDGDPNAQDLQATMQTENPESKSEAEFRGKYLRDEFKAVRDSLESQNTAKYTSKY